MPAHTRTIHTKYIEMSLTLIHLTPISYARANRKIDEFNEALSKGANYLQSLIESWEIEFGNEINQAGK